jgi:hypothetical protein
MCREPLLELLKRRLDGHVVMWRRGHGVVRVRRRAVRRGRRRLLLPRLLRHRRRQCDSRAHGRLLHRRLLHPSAARVGTRAQV